MPPLHLFALPMQLSTLAYLRRNDGAAPSRAPDAPGPDAPGAAPAEAAR